MDDASGQDVFAQALAADGPGQVAGTIDAGAIEQGGPPDAGQGQQPEPGAQPQPEGRPQGQDPDRGEAMVPSWRLREISEQREAERREFQRLQREHEEAQRWRQEREEADRRREAEKAQQSAEFDWENPNRFVDQRLQHGLRQAMDPVQQQIQAFHQQQHAIIMHNARLVAGQVFGADKVKAAEEAFNRAVNERRIDPAEAQRINSAPNPFEAAHQWFQRQSTLEAIGGDLEGYNQRQQDALLKDPAFLQRALEAHRSMASPVQAGVPGRAAAPARPQLPSLNRQTSAADDGAEGDASAVFASEIAARGRRPG